MVTKMKKYTFLVYNRDYDIFLTFLRQRGVVHISHKHVDEVSDDVLQQHLQKKMEISHLLKQEASDALLAEQNDLRQHIATLTKEIENIRIWGNFQPAKLQTLQQAGYTLHFYSCKNKVFNPKWGIEIQTKDNTTYFATFDNTSIPTSCTEHTLSSRSLTEMENELSVLSQQLNNVKNSIEEWKKTNIPYLENELHQVENNIEWQNIKLGTKRVADGAIAVVEGYCPIDESKKLNEQLDSNLEIAQYYQCSDPDDIETTPIQLKNNRFIRLFECLTSMYGLPKYSEFDPTPILGPFFLLFFSLCIGDAGYGLLLVLIGFLLHKRKLNIAMFDGLGPIIMALGGGSAIIGYLMGTCFGIDIFSATWMPQQLKAVMFKNLGDNGKIGEYDIMMILALVVGVVHICLAMVVKAISYTRIKGFKATISTWAWLFLCIGLIIIFSLQMGMHLSSNVVKWLVISVGAISALGIFIFNHPGRNPLINIGAGLWDTYGTVTGLLGDILSYIRLYALGLAGGMLGMAFNQLGSMVLSDNPNALTVIGFVLIVTFGHILNLLMACLGAFVHPLRLTFVEYFKNAGYQGTGNKYQPFKL